MAKFNPSAIVSEIRGSIKDITFSKTTGGPTIKGKLVQPASSTADQILRRDAMAAGVLAWQGLTEAQFLLWFEYVTQFNKSKSISRKIAISAFNEFTSRYINRSLLSSAVTGFKPHPTVRLYPILSSLACAVNTINVNWLLVELRSNCKICIFASAPVSPGRRTFSPSQYRFMQYITPGSTTGTENIFAAMDTKFSLSAADNGKRIAVAIKAVNDDNFAASEFSFGNIILSGLT